MKWINVFVVGGLVACGDTPGGSTDASSSGPDGATVDGAIATDASGDMASDDFERPGLGTDWVVVYPPTPPNTQVQILDSSDLGMGPGPEGFFLVNWTRRAFAADQFCEATIPIDVTPGWAHMVYVRWRASDRARYGFAYDNDPSQPNFGDWIFKYDGVPGPETRIIASAAATATPQPGDTLRIEVVGYTLRGYLNGALVLEATDTDATKIADGVPGLAARWAVGNQSTTTAAKVWESWAGGSL